MTTSDGVDPALAARFDEADPLLLLTDFDGTLARIADAPDAARPLADVPAILESLAARPSVDVGIVSGRSLADLRERIAVPGVGYAGNHGLERSFRDETAVHPGAAAARPSLDAIAGRLGDDLDGVPGVEIEDKRLSLTVHYRRASPAAERRVRKAVREAASAFDDLRLTSGKQVVEVRPAVECDKGVAVEWFLERVPDDAVPAFLGDDLSDADAFAVVEARGGVSVRVGDEPGVDAAFAVETPEDVRALLRALDESRS